MKILDIGTGLGFFSIIPEQAGHSVIDIDCAKGMLEEALLNAVAAGVEPEFMLMDCHKLTDADRAVSDVVSMNLPLSSRLRPAWDLIALRDIGFSEVFVKHDITDIVWDEAEKTLHRSTPMFLVGAKK